MLLLRLADQVRAYQPDCPHAGAPRQAASRFVVAGGGAAGAAAVAALKSRGFAGQLLCQDEQVVAVVACGYSRSMAALSERMKRPSARAQALALINAFGEGSGA